MTADSDLPWYFGTADKTMSGDLGLRSSMGGQLAAAESCMYYDEQGHEHGGQLAERSFTNEAEGAMFQRLRYAADAKRIEAKLRTLSRMQVDALRLHYSTASLPFGVPAAASVLPRVKREQSQQGDCMAELRALLMTPVDVAKDATKAEREAAKKEFHEMIDRLTKAANDLVRGARDAYDRASGGDVRSVQVNEPGKRRAHARGPRKGEMLPEYVARVEVARKGVE